MNDLFAVCAAGNTSPSMNDLFAVCAAGNTSPSMKPKAFGMSIA